MSISKVKIGDHWVQIKPIQWTDSSRLQVVAFMARCPHCMWMVWINKKDEYAAWDGELVYKCPHCGYCKPRRRPYNDKPTIEFNGLFNTKNVGWTNCSGPVVDSDNQI